MRKVTPALLKQLYEWLAHNPNNVKPRMINGVMCYCAEDFNPYNKGENMENVTDPTEKCCKEGTTEECCKEEKVVDAEVPATEEAEVAPAVDADLKDTAANE